VSMEDVGLLESVRSALRHLYDLSILAESPLMARFGFPQSSQGALALRQLLVETVESLEPSPQVPADSHPWRVYEILLYRYVQQRSQVQVGEQLGMSVRHLRRQETEAIEELALALSRRSADQEPRQPKIPRDDHINLESQNDELAWLVSAESSSSVNLDETLTTVLDLARPLADRYSARLARWLGHTRLPIAVHPLALRQALLSLLTVAIHRSRDQIIHVDVQQQGQQTILSIVGGDGFEGEESYRDESDALDLVKRLLDPWGVQLRIDTQPAFIATVRLPAASQRLILLIDDNRDTWQLFHRYLTGTRFSLCCAESIEDALALCTEHPPELILLDVMMPNADGWEVLGRLQVHPLTRKVPVVVCTILVHEELALSLGARAYLHKPVSRQDLLGLLNAEIGQAATGSS